MVLNLDSRLRGNDRIWTCLVGRTKSIMDNKSISEKTKEIEKIYQEYIDKLNALKKEQDKILQEFIAELEKRKIEEIKDKIKSFQ